MRRGFASVFRAGCLYMVQGASLTAMRNQGSTVSIALLSYISLYLNDPIRRLR